MDIYVKRRRKMDNKFEADGTVSVFLDMKKGHEMRSKLSDITDCLELSEKISIVFLLCKNSKTGIEIMEQMLQESDNNTQNNLFYKWMRKQYIFVLPNWQECLAEVLAIIQNFKLAKLLGFSIDNLLENFQPKNNLMSYNVSLSRKVLYNLSKKLTRTELNELVKVIEKTHSSLHIDNFGYFEYYLLYWSEKKLINLAGEEEIDLCILIKSLKSLNLNNLVHDIEVLVEKNNDKLVRKKLYSRVDNNCTDCYPIIDEINLGLCVIINQKNFSESLFPKRWGTDKDVQRLVEIFTAFNFDIHIHSDLAYEKFLSTLGYYAKAVDTNLSFFVLIILSHGSENVIFTSDSFPINMDSIEMIFQAEVCPNLIGKPKIFIVQSCQGEKWQKVLVNDNEPEITSDNFVPNKSNFLPIGPQRGDSMIAWSTVQGFASFRDKHNGSWYIEELCNELWKYGDVFDLVEIFTRVNNNLRSKVYSGQFMVPSLLLSLRAKVKFPQIKKNFLKGKKLMLERLIFEKYFKEFLLNNKSFDINTLITN